MRRLCVLGCYCCSTRSLGIGGGIGTMPIITIRIRISRVWRNGIKWLGGRGRHSKGKLNWCMSPSRSSCIATSCRCSQTGIWKEITWRSSRLKSNKIKKTHRKFSPNPRDLLRHRIPNQLNSQSQPNSPIEMSDYFKCVYYKLQMSINESFLSSTS